MHSSTRLKSKREKKDQTGDLTHDVLSNGLYAVTDTFGCLAQNHRPLKEEASDIIFVCISPSIFTRERSICLTDPDPLLHSKSNAT